MFHILLLVLSRHRILYLRISSSVHLCTCVTIKRFDLNVVVALLPINLKYRICVPRMNKGLTGLERHEGEYLNYIIFFFRWTILLSAFIDTYGWVVTCFCRSIGTTTTEEKPSTCLTHHIHKQREVSLATMYFHKTHAVLFINHLSANSYNVYL